MMATTEPGFERHPLGGSVRSYTAPERQSSASTWYLVIGAAVLLTVLYLLTTGLMRDNDPLVLTSPQATSQDMPVAPVAEAPPR